MLKLTNDFLEEIVEKQKTDARVCVPDVPDLKRMILEEGHRSNLSIHPGVTK
ncbi:hypothetical protein A2U01_0070069, partial [Trifolium medium]|nr:hypothetical protein [Trifolium medium]